MDLQANFEKAYWKLEPALPDDKKELATTTLRSIALTELHRAERPKTTKGPSKIHQPAKETK